MPVVLLSRKEPPIKKPKGSLLTVLIAFGANLLIAIAKSFAALVTGSASMVAEAAHSWADTGNEIFLLVAERHATRERDAAHPFGYGRGTYVWSMFAAMGLFTAGAVVSIMHGISELSGTEKNPEYTIAYVVFAVAAVLEGTSFLQAFRQAHGQASRRGIGTLESVLSTSNSTLRAVFAEDAAALAGLAIGFLGIFLHQVTGEAVYDAIGSILIGVLLAIVAVILMDRNRRFLVGQGTSPAIENAAVAELLERPEIARVSYLHLEFVGPGKVFLIAAVDLVGNDTEEHVATALRRVEREIESDPHIEFAVLTLAEPNEPSMTVYGPVGPPIN